MVINNILATDIKEHFSYMKRFESIVEEDTFNEEGKN